MTQEAVRLVYRTLPTPDVLIVQRCSWTVVADPRMDSQDVENIVGMVQADAARHGLDGESTIPDARRYVSFRDVPLVARRRIVFRDAVD